MKLRFAFLLSLVVFAISNVALAPALRAAPSGDKPWSQLTPEEKVERKAKWDAMSPADKEKFKAQKRAERKAAWDKMTPAERNQAKAANKAKWDKLSPERKAQIEAERNAKWQAMSPEEKAKIKAEHKAAWEERYKNASQSEKVEMMKRREEAREHWKKQHAGDGAAPAAASK